METLSASVVVTRIASGATMQKSNGLYLVIGILVAVIAIGGYYFYQESQKSGIDVEIGDQGISVETK
jgi:hypothetical protein